MSTVFTYYPSGGRAPISFRTGDAATYRLLTLQGIEPVSLTPQSIKSPGQSGETAVDVIVPPRVVVVQALLQAASHAAAWNARAALNRAFASQPVRLGEDLQRGRVRLTLDGREPLELDVLPQSVAFQRPRGAIPLLGIDIEFYADNPFWREVDDSRLIFQTDAGGFEFDLEYPLEMTSNNVQQEVNNEGDVDAPVLIRIYGECDTPRMINVTTGETIEISGTVPAMGSGDAVEPYLEINTAFGQKSVTLIDGSGARTSVMDALNLDMADFWTLRPGINVVKFEADTNPSGHAEIFWRQRYSGV